MLRGLKTLWWNGILRSVAFWAIVGGVLLSADGFVPYLDATLMAATVRVAIEGDFEGLSALPFALSMAAAIFALAFAFAAAFLVTHVLLIRLALARAARLVGRHSDMNAFAHSYEAVRQRLQTQPLIGHAWEKFCDTLLPRKSADEVVRSTVRPQMFINIAVARERLLGLKIMGNIPGYFVGVGLLLTFIGLVLALNKAATAVNSSDAGGMQIATRQLLEVATFKFATSIAGLGSSIVLSILFRLYTIWLEAAFDRFCAAVERQLRYIAPQSIAAELNDIAMGQLTELKQINSADFFARMGQSISPQIQSAFTTAMAPIAASIDQAVGRLSDTNQSGLSNLIEQFAHSVQGAAGQELRGMAEMLQALRNTLEQTQQGMHGTAADFGRQLSQAAESLSRMVVDAGASLSKGADLNRSALEEIVKSLRQTFENANQRVDEDLGRAASGAAGRVEAAMGRVLERLEAPVDSLSGTLKQIDASLSAQIAAVRDATAQFAAAANDVRSASGPLQASSEHIAGATLRMTESIGRSVTALETGQEASKKLADTLAEHVARASSLWSEYARRFEKIDGELAKAIEDLAEATKTQGEQLVKYASDVDGGFADAISRLNPLLSELKDSAGELGETVADLRDHLKAEAAD